MPEASNRERCKSGLDFEKVVFNLLSKNDIPYIRDTGNIACGILKVLEMFIHSAQLLENYP